MITIDEKDRIRISAFLVSNAGKTFIAWLREPQQRPEIRTNNVQPHDVQMDAGAVKGYDRCIEKIESFVRIPDSESDVEETPRMRETRTIKS